MKIQILKKYYKMTVQETLMQCLIYYPEIFPNRWSVYHQWFCVNGCGYNWEDGELVDDSGSYINVLPTLISKEEVIKRTADFTNTERDPRYPIYPMYSGGSMILNIPDNIKPDWKEAVIEFATWILNSGIKIKDEHKEYLINYLKKNES